MEHAVMAGDGAQGNDGAGERGVEGGGFGQALGEELTPACTGRWWLLSPERHYRRPALDSWHRQEHAG
jgi:hypothetical protein